MRIPPRQGTTTLASAWFGAFLLVCLGACRGEDTVGPAATPLSLIAVRQASGNVLTARATVAGTGIDSVRIRYTSATDGVRYTPSVGMTTDTVRVRVAGLRANTDYLIQAEGWRGARLIQGDTTHYLTDSLPVPLRTFTLSPTTGTPSAGYLLVPALAGGVGYLVAFDSAGTIRWYLDASPYYPGASPADLKQLPNGNILAYLGATRGWDPIFGKYYEFNLDGEVVRTYSAPLPLYTDNHDMVLEFSDSVPVAAVLFGYDIRGLDLTAYGGAASVAVAGHQLIRLRLNGTTDFFWNGWDHLSLLDWTEEPQAAKLGATSDFDHPNSLAIDLDGNYVVSWRNFGEVSKIDARTGALLWRWGGRNNQFTFVNDAMGFFSGQHSVRVLPNGHYLIYDNGIRHQPSETRIAEYQLDVNAHTATLVWEYRHTPAYYTGFLGYVTRLASGNTLIAWGAIGILQEVTPAGQTVWEARVLNNGAPSIFYRGIRVPDLSTYRTP